MLGALWFIQRRVTRGSAGRAVLQPIRVIAKQTLGAKAQLVVVEVDDARYVLGVTEGGLSVIDRLPAAALQQSTVTADASDRTDDRELPAPLPLRRAELRSMSSNTLSGRAIGRHAPPARTAAQALRRALGA
ncbi:flagellar biosynthetic protein FliO [Microbacterium sp. zg.Y625]|uniref:FliO/MopB family protein n=1 Tax=Microbacterium jiangjiandongii TaxID=3049071 RepID=UPI00214B45CF|nr:MULTISPECIES: flagellar biosynthetic protein FliO [unclassified Microbacterium]MCR2793215.1 flagellar biosynthetic protein FliO [Microbacterium sp. zg.Y625]WIM25406.1 flagellar biosynthetic protein FliO [Microbacterium sp. zg-Y625]